MNIKINILVKSVMKIQYQQEIVRVVQREKFINSYLIVNVNSEN